MEYQNLINIDLELTGKKLKQAIESSEYTEQELIKYLEITMRAIKYWKSGGRLPSIDNIFHLCRIFDISIYDVLVFEDEGSKFNWDKKLKEMSESGSSLFMYFYRQKFRIKTVEDFIAYLPLYDENVLSDVLLRISGKSISKEVYMLEQFDYLYNQIADIKTRDKISEKLKNDSEIWNTHFILAIVDAETYEMAKMSSYYKGECLKDYIKGLVRDDFEKNGLQINKYQQDWIEVLESLNEEDETYGAKTDFKNFRKKF